MRLNGYTPLSELVRDDEEDALLPTAQQLVASGWAKFCEEEGVPRESQWGSLLGQADA